MASPYVKKIAKETGKSEKEIESFWDKAKGIASDTLGTPEDKFGSKEYAYTVGIVKNMLGIKEDVLNPTKFLESEYSAKEYIETITSSSFPKLTKDHIIPPEKDDETEEEIEEEVYEDLGDALDRMIEEMSDEDY